MKLSRLYVNIFMLKCQTITLFHSSFHVILRKFHFKNMKMITLFYHEFHVITEPCFLLGWQQRTSACPNVYVVFVAHCLLQYIKVALIWGS